MNVVFSAAADLQEFCRSLGWRLVFSELEPLLELKQGPESARRLREMISRLENAP